MPKRQRSARRLLREANARTFRALEILEDLEPPHKRAQASRRRKAAQILVTAYRTDPLAKHARSVAKWPQPRHDVVLDVTLLSAKPGGARIDKICKWLLDVLEGPVYRNDRQVKMLWAVAGRPRGPLPQYARAAGVTEEYLEQLAVEIGLAAQHAGDAEEPASSFSVTARTYADVLRDLRAVRQIAPSWRAAPKANISELDESIRAHEKYISLIDPNDPDPGERAEYEAASNQLLHDRQLREQHVVDDVFSGLFTRIPLAAERPHGVRAHLRSPYIFDLGPRLGTSGAGEFEQHVRALLAERRARHPELFPLRVISGITLLVSEGDGDGKDLDNLLRSILPDILDILHPQTEPLEGLLPGQPSPDLLDPTIQFLEIMAVPTGYTDLAPNSVVFGLSAAPRYDSWWTRAAQYLQDASRGRSLSRGR